MVKALSEEAEMTQDDAEVVRLCREVVPDVNSEVPQEIHVVPQSR
jgi:hypothetical protein